jgi:hypothetical protein
MILNLETPALLFSATSLILLAYTNRFLTIAQIVRGLKATYENNHSQTIILQINNLRKRLNLIKNMQLCGVLSLFFSVFTMLMIYLGFEQVAVYMFGSCLFLLLISLGLSFWEISISIKALEVHLDELNTQK